jgi:Gpi18-like mannosyltransferase
MLFAALMALALSLLGAVPLRWLTDLAANFTPAYWRAVLAILIPLLLLTLPAWPLGTDYLFCSVVLYAVSCFVLLRKSENRIGIGHALMFAFALMLGISLMANLSRAGLEKAGLVHLLKRK